MTLVIMTTRLVLEYRNHILFLEQTAQNGGGYTLPGGKVELAEFARDALIRETREETGMKLKKKSVKLIHVLHRRLPKNIEMVFFFGSSDWEGNIESKEPEKFQNAVWFPIDALPEKMPNVIRHALADIRAGKTYSEYPKPEKEKKNKLK